MRRVRAFSILLILSTLGMALGPVQVAHSQDTTTVPVTVTSASGRNVYLDKGSNAGLQAGMVVTLRPPNRATVPATIRSVSSTSARAELAPGEILVVPGTNGDVLVPVVVEPVLDEGEEPPAQAAEGEGEAEVPEHPPWEYQDLDTDQSSPLLAPVRREPPETRPVTVSGRWYVNYDYVRDQGFGRDRTYHAFRTGATLRITNPFGKGGRIDFDGDIDYFNSDVHSGFGTDYSSTRFDVDELSYTYGGQDYAPYQLEVGRFYPDDLPEIGPMDGAEGTLQFEHGWRGGFGVGSYLRPFLSRASGEDYGFHIFADYQSEGERHLSGTIAYQKTWHEGEADRDLILGRFNWRPIDTLWLFGSTKIDIYTADDVAKSSGPHLTELFTSANWTPSAKVGVTGTFNHYEWVSVSRREFENIVDELIAEGKVDRAYASAWWRPLEWTRLTLRLGLWEDQVGHGDNGEVNFELSPVNWRLAVDGGVYWTNASHLDGTGWRLRGTYRLNAGVAYVSYDQFDFSRPAYAGPLGDGLRRVIRAGVDFNVGRWSHSIYGDRDFGDDEDAYRLGFYSSYRF